MSAHYRPGFSDRILLEQGYILFFHEGLLDNQEPYYLYLAVKGTNLPDYYSLIAQNPPPSLEVLGKLGFIAAYGTGAPDEETKLMLKDRFGVNCA